MFGDASLCSALQKAKREESSEEAEEGSAGPWEVPAVKPAGSQNLEVSIREAEPQPFRVLMQFLYTDKIQYPRRGQPHSLTHPLTHSFTGQSVSQSLTGHSLTPECSLDDRSHHFHPTLQFKAHQHVRFSKSNLPFP